MLQISYIRENTEDVKKRLQKKYFNDTAMVDKAIELDHSRRTMQVELDDLNARSNTLAREIGDLFKQGKQEEAQNKKQESLDIKEKSKVIQDQLLTKEQELNEILYLFPNLPHESVPEGKTPEENEVCHEEGNIPELGENSLPHWDLAKKFDLIDFELGVKISGAGFPVYKGKGARLQRALISFFLDEAQKNGYEEIMPPLVVNEASGYGTGQLPDKEGQMYHVTADNLYLIPTAEVPITNLHRDVIYKAKELPVKQTGYTPCFRREAGSYGKDVRGLNRLHQFDKVEIVQVTRPEESYRVLDEMSEYVKSLLRKLELPFRTLRLCGGDMSFASALTFDMEVFSAAQKRWLEVSSVSNFETFQSNRLKLRYKDEDGKTKLAHTLNGSALALPRIVAALLENNQDSEGIRIPEVLVPYTGFNRI